MYPRNAASPERIAIGPVVLIADGTVQTATVSVKVLPQGGAAGAGGGTIAYEEGIVHYLPTQAETNYTSFILIAYKASCIPASVTVVTSASATAGKVVLSGETHTSAVIPTVTTTTTATNLTNLPAAAALEATLTAMKGATYVEATDSLEALRNRGDAAWATATGFATPTNITAASGITLAAVTHTGAVIPTVTTLTGHTAQTGDTFALANGATGFVAIDTVVDAIKAKTDSLTFTTAGIVDANVQQINDVTITGNGGTGTEFGV